MRQPHIVGIGGTTRPGSSTERALRRSLVHAESLGATTQIFSGELLAQLPMYAPESPVRSPHALAYIDALREADGVIVASPGYHGAVSGLVKNALDYVEDLRENDRCYLEGLPVGLIATGAGWQAIVATLNQLRTVVHALRGWPTPMGAAIDSTQLMVDERGRIVDERADWQLVTVTEQVVEFATIRLTAACARDAALV
jgi:FMN reductase